MNSNPVSIRFVLDGRIVAVDFNSDTELRPTTTVLNYLRSLPAHKGVKEGCAEGDCGACTVVLAEIRNGVLRYCSVDSCLVFLPMLHGKQLITIENLARPQALHPVQQEIVNHFGSQCGYCTPGVVMSMFSLYKNFSHPSREVIQDALTGNLCRCTGYRPIIEAAGAACMSKEPDEILMEEKKIAGMLQEINQDRSPIEIHTTGQHYYKPLKLQDALDFRKKFPGAVLICGATDIALRQTKKGELLTEIIDISDLDELKYFKEDETCYRIGAGLSLENLKGHSEGILPALNQMLRVFGSLQIRNMATLGGNIGSASPIGDTIPVLMAYQAMVRLQKEASSRLISLEDFIRGYRATDLHADELLTEILIPKPGNETRVCCYKVSKRRNLDISTVSAGFCIRLQEGNVEKTILAFGGMAAQTRRASKTERFLEGRSWIRPVIDEAMGILNGEFTPLSDARAGSGYRTLVARNLLLKFFVETSTSGRP